MMLAFRSPLLNIVTLNKALSADTLSAECAHVAAGGSLPADT